MERLDFEKQMLVVCGNNKRMFQEISGMKTKKSVKLYGYVSNVDVMMDAADCIVTKPGGLTTSEALAKNLPMIMVNPIPGQEERNAEFLLNYGLAMRATEKFTPAEAVFALLSDPEVSAGIKRNMERFARPDSTETLCNYLFEKMRQYGRIL